ncbi:histidine kinase [Paenibacillus filicis]|uniref:histidine kinase n=1 Tax=Paenibacillus gyeongsangnamensis TaxID=3388067 RepID=A0ABT4QBJ0_9BACL|nr:histidine kinase [Paenibacillus filicis]MCZ8514190.1 histidine kinase [Paenibacillus filicis]
MRTSLAARVFLYFSSVIVISAALVGVTLYVQSARTIDAQSKEMLTQIVDNALHHTDLYLKGYEHATLSVLTSPLMKEFLELREKDVYSYYMLSAQIKEKVFQPIFIKNPGISMMYLIGYNGIKINQLGIAQPSFRESLLQESLDDLKNLTKDDGSMTLMDWSFLNNHLAITRKISVRQTSRAFKGILGIEFKIEELNKLWKGIRLGETGYFYIVNEYGRIVYHPKADRIGKQLDGELFTKLQAREGQFFNSKDDGSERVHFSRRSDYSGWTLVASMPVNELYKPIDNIRRTTIFTCLLAFLLAFLLAYRFSRSLVRPIRMLENGMRETEKGNWSEAQIPLTGSKDEMDRLILSYNVMVTRLSGLVDQVVAAELKNQEHLLGRHVAEFQALQLQINPHFLYNTLETIICYAVVQDSKEIKEMVRSLSYMLRYSVQTNLEEITVASELKHVLHFMTIMNHRFGREFEIQVLVAPEYLLRHMVRLTLQPIVENVFNHAFPEGLEDHHSIVIDGRIENDDFIMTIADNGEGIRPDRLAELQERLAHSSPLNGPEEEGDGIGLLNVHSRIRMVFGEAYGVMVDSVEGSGTVVTLRLPDRSAPLLQHGGIMSIQRSS